MDRGGHSITWEQGMEGVTSGLARVSPVRLSYYNHRRLLKRELDTMSDVVQF